MMRRGLKLIFFLFFTFSINTIAQNLYSGKVIDENNQPVFGASIIIKKNSNFVQTDIDGKFLIEAEINDILLISYSGFKNIELQSPKQYKKQMDAAWAHAPYTGSKGPEGPMGPQGPMAP